jgi:hypothetical protein
MTTRYKYAEVPDPYSWEVPSIGDARFTWEYDDGRAQLLSLYQKGKDKQWDAQSRIDWAQDVDAMNPVGRPDEFHPLFGSPMWDTADQARRDEMRQPTSWTRHTPKWPAGSSRWNRRSLRVRANPCLDRRALVRCGAASWFYRVSRWKL